MFCVSGTTETVSGIVFVLKKYYVCDISQWKSYEVQKSSRYTRVFLKDP